MQVFSVPRVAGTTIARAIIPQFAGHRALIQHLVVTSDKAASVIKFRRGLGRYVVQQDQASGDSTIVLDTVAGFSPADVFAIISKAGAPTFKTIAGGGVNAGTNTLTVTGTIGQAIKKGDLLFRVTDYSQRPLGATTVVLGPLPTGALEISAAGAPLVIEIDGTANCSVDICTGQYAA